MPQEQRFIEIRHGMSRVGTGVATGNNACWPCRCGRPEWLIGRSGDLAGKWDVQVQCPDCQARYFVYPSGQDQGGVDYVQKL